MEDNNYRHEEFDDCFLCKHPALRHFLTGLLVFLGAFSAFYVISDWHFKRMYDPAFYMRRMDKAIMQRENDYNKMEMREFKHNQKLQKKFMKHEERLSRDVGRFVHVEKLDDAYKIIIDLRPFDNNEKNVEVKTSGNTMTINAAGEKNIHNKQELIRYNQTFSFAENIDASNIIKERRGDDYIITVPFED